MTVNEPDGRRRRRRPEAPSKGQIVSSAKLAIVRKLVSWGCKKSLIAAFAEVDDKLVDFVYSRAFPGQKPPNAQTGSASAADAETRQLYVAVATEFQNLVARGLDEKEAALNAFEQIRALHGTTVAGQRLKGDVWLSLYRNLKARIAYLHRCIDCGGNVLVEDVRNTRMQRLSCGWCRKQLGTIDFTAPSRRRGPLRMY